MNIFSFFTDYVLGFFLLISILVFVHEMGHYLFAKYNGVKVEAFSIGFGPELLGWTDKSGTRWKIAPIPFGGYVKMKGEMLEIAKEGVTYDNDSFQAKNLFQKFSIVFAGPLFNFIFPIFILLFVAFFAGIPQIQPKIGEIAESSPAYSFLQKGDIIKFIDGKAVKDFSDIRFVVAQNPNKTLPFVVHRDKKDLNLSITIGSKQESGHEIGFLGVGADSSTIFTSKYDIASSLSYTYDTYIKVVVLIVDSLGKLFSGKVGLDDIGGPIKIAQVSGDTLQQGLGSWLFFMAMLSLNLAVLNLLPIPALDGGHLLMYIIQGVTRKKISVKIQTKLMQMGFILLISLMIFVVFKDIFSFF